MQLSSRTGAAAFLAIATLLATTSTSFAQQSNDQHPWGQGRKWGNGANAAPQQTNLPETKALMNNDNLLPGLNRTNAMRTEAETGHLWPAADKEIAPYIPKKRTVVQPKRTRFQSVDKPHAHVPRDLVQEYKAK